MTAEPAPRPGAPDVPRLTACSLCSGETLAGVDALPGGQRARLDRLATTGVTRITYVECLDECERGDVVVARPSASQRAKGVGPVWFERLAGDLLTRELERWLIDGGPGARPVPGRLAGLTVRRTGEPVASPDVDHSAHHHGPGGDTVSETSVTDPVCAMTVDPATAAASSEHEGTTYHFCAKGCQKAFLADPTRYL